VKYDIGVVVINFYFIQRKPTRVSAEPQPKRIGCEAGVKHLDFVGGEDEFTGSGFYAFFNIGDAVLLFKYEATRSAFLSSTVRSAPNSLS
jgi:hypothetical protein